jgi:hypothetical protein
MEMYDKAIQHFLKAKDIYTKALGVDHPRGCFAAEGLAKAYFSSGHLAKARILMQEVVRVRLARLGPDDGKYKGSAALLAKYEDASMEHGGAIRIE